MAFNKTKIEEEEVVIQAKPKITPTFLRGKKVFFHSIHSGKVWYRLWPDFVDPFPIPLSEVPKIMMFEPVMLAGPFLGWIKKYEREKIGEVDADR